MDTITFNEAKIRYEKNDLAEALEILDAIIHDNKETDALLLRARIFYRLQKWGEAMNDYSSVLEAEPDHREAKTGLEMAQNILGYFTPDMFNP
jgi:tetratricopeptide (TPR) repeat protein